MAGEKIKVGFWQFSENLQALTRRYPIPRGQLVS